MPPNLIHPNQPQDGRNPAEPARAIPDINMPPGNYVPAMPPQPNAPVAPLPIASASGGPGRKRKMLKLSAVIAAVLVLLGGAASAAYIGYFLPNTPENILKTALSNTLETKEGKFDIKLSSADDSEGAFIQNVEVDIEGGFNLTQHSLDTRTDIKIGKGAAEIKAPSLYARWISDNVYFKVGDLTPLGGLVGSQSSAGKIIQEINQHTKDQWFEVSMKDLNAEAYAQCVNQLLSPLDKEDIDKLLSKYSDSQFAKLESHSSENVDGHDAIKYNFAIENSKLKSYANGLNELSYVKKVNDCFKGASGEKLETPSVPDVGSSGSTHISLWADKAEKRVIKLEWMVDPANNELKIDAKTTMNFHYEAANITVPEGAKPYKELADKLSNLTVVDSALLPSFYAENLYNAPAPGSSSDFQQQFKFDLGQ